MNYKAILENNKFLQLLSADDRSAIFTIFEFVAEGQREEAAQMLERQPSLIPILIENFLKKRDAFVKGGRPAVEKLAQDDRKMIQKHFEE